jgi:hypothetical protein
MKWLSRNEAFLIAVNQAAKRATADIEGHFTAAELGQPRRLRQIVEPDGIKSRWRGLSP